MINELIDRGFTKNGMPDLQTLEEIQEQERVRTTAYALNMLRNNAFFAVSGQVDRIAESRNGFIAFIGRKMQGGCHVLADLGFA